jgi:lipopolysaccharide export system protein LptA
MSRPAAKVLLLASLACAGHVLARSSDRQQPMDLEANHQDCSVDDAGPCVFSGNVRILQGTLDIRAARADVQRGDGDIRRVILSGSPVQLSQQLDNGSRMNARAAKIDYDMPRETVVLTGKAHLEQPGRSSIDSERIVYNMRTGQMQSGRQGGGQRVKMQIIPRGARQAPAARPQGTN